MSTVFNSSSNLIDSLDCQRIVQGGELNRSQRRKSKSSYGVKGVERFRREVSFLVDARKQQSLQKSRRS